MSMRMVGRSSLLTVMAIALAVLFGMRPAHAAPSGPTPTVLELAPPQPIDLGKNATISLTLSSKQGAPVPRHRVQLYLDGINTNQSWTDTNGRASFTVGAGLNAGAHKVEVVFAGTKLYATSRASTQLTIAPAKLSLLTEPPLKGMQFAIDGKIYTTGSDGTVVVRMERPGEHKVEILPPRENQQLQTVFSRWQDEVFVTTRVIKIPQTSRMVAGFHINEPATFRFVDLNDKAVDPARITSVRLKSSNGIIYTLTDMQPTVVRSWHTTRRVPGRLQAGQVQYYVESVIIDGSEVVNQGQQRFEVTSGQDWSIRLLMYSVDFQARDAIFKFPVGTGVDLEYPDGRKKFYPFDQSGALAINDLVRGLYRVQVAGAAGIAPLTPVALSRSQSVELLVVTQLDLFVIFGVLTLIGLAFLFIGRTVLWKMLLNPVGTARMLLSPLMPAALRNSFEQTLWRLQSYRPTTFASSRQGRPADPIIAAATMFFVVGLLGIFTGFRVISAMDTARAAEQAASAVVAPRMSKAAAARASETQVLAATERPGNDTPAIVSEAAAAQASETQVPAATERPGNDTPAIVTDTPQPGPDVISPEITFRELKLRSKGDDVALLQTRLRQLGYFDYPENTGYFGVVTESALKAFQKDRGLPNTGIMDRRTADALSRR